MRHHARGERTRVSHAATVSVQTKKYLCALNVERWREEGVATHFRRSIFVRSGDQHMTKAVILLITIASVVDGPDTRSFLRRV